MTRVYAIALNTFREAVRDRILVAVVGAASALLLFTLALGELSLDQERRVVMDLGMASISLFAVLIAVFLGSSLLYKEIERKTLYVILPKPIARYELLLGKYVGIVLTAVVFVLLMGGVQLWVMAFQADAPTWALVALPAMAAAVFALGAWRLRDPTAWVPLFGVGLLASAVWLASTRDVDVVACLAALSLDVGEIVLISAVAMVFSSFSTPFLTGLLTVGVWLVGRSADSMATMSARAVPPEVLTLLHGLAEIVPNFHLFVPSHAALTGEHSPAGGLAAYLASTLGYGVLYAAGLLAAAAAIFRRRDFL